MTEKRYSKKQQEELQKLERDMTVLQNKLSKDIVASEDDIARRRRNMTRGCTDKIKELNTKKRLEQEKLKALQKSEENALRRRFVQQQDDLNKEFVEPFIQVEKDLAIVVDGLLKIHNENLNTLQQAYDIAVMPLRARRDEILASPVNAMPVEKESRVQTPAAAPATN